MVATLVPGPINWNMKRDQEGHRTYEIWHRVRTDDPKDGPVVISSTPGLPLIGSIWFFDNDVDSWAFCWPTMEVTPVLKGEPNKFWTVKNTFSTKPLNRCQDEEIEDPLLEPDRISGTFVKYTEEVRKDRNGNFIQTSSHEQVRGPQVEFDHNRPTVRIEQNTVGLELDVFSQMVDTVNDATLWGLGARKIKLSNVSWQRKLYGTCTFYYTRVLDFDINFNTFDRELLDEGNKVLHGHWEDTGWVLDNINGGPPDPNNAQHFDRFKDRKGENAKTILDGAGKPWDGSGTALPGTVDVEYYPESDFFLLGVPVVLA